MLFMISYYVIYDYHYIVQEEKQDLFCLCVLSYPNICLGLLRNSLFPWISSWLNYYSCYSQTVSKTMEDSASYFSTDEYRNNSHVIGGNYSCTVCSAARVAEGTSSYSSASIPRTSIGVEATPHLKTTRIEYTSRGVKNKLVLGCMHQTMLCKLKQLQHRILPN